LPKQIECKQTSADVFVLFFFSNIFKFISI
jgi:hypothetical protein